VKAPGETEQRRTLTTKNIIYSHKTGKGTVYTPPKASAQLRPSTDELRLEDRRLDSGGWPAGHASLYTPSFFPSFQKRERLQLKRHPKGENESNGRKALQKIHGAPSEQSLEAKRWQHRNCWLPDGIADPSCHHPPRGIQKRN